MISGAKSLSMNSPNRIEVNEVYVDEKLQNKTSFMIE